MIRTKKKQLINSRTGDTAIVRAVVTERLTTEDNYTVICHYQSVSVSQDEEGNDVETFTLIDSVERNFTNEQVDGLYAAYKDSIQSENFSGIYNELTVLSLKNIVAADGNWSLTINDWEEE